MMILTIGRKIVENPDAIVGMNRSNKSGAIKNAHRNKRA
jgi:hypothetical protein